jgi:hypothetical protein
MRFGEKLQVTEANRTVSTVSLSASREMHGGKLSCKVENPLVPNSHIKASQKLQIHCKNFRTLYITILQSTTIYDMN